jgi:hypothetical protein
MNKMIIPGLIFLTVLTGCQSDYKTTIIEYPIDS